MQHKENYILLSNYSDACPHDRCKRKKIQPLRICTSSSTEQRKPSQKRVHRYVMGFSPSPTARNTVHRTITKPNNHDLLQRLSRTSCMDTDLNPVTGSTLGSDSTRALLSRAIISPAAFNACVLGGHLVHGMQSRPGRKYV